MTIQATHAATLDYSVDDLLDSMLDDLSTKPKVPDTPEDTFLNYFCGDKFGKIVIMAHWLRSQCAIYDRMAEYNLCLASSYNKDGTIKRAEFKRYARILIEHYLMSSHPHWFIHSGIQGRIPADMGKVIDRLLEVDKIKGELFSKNRT